MGPDHINKSQRHDDFLAHTGERIGGNDFDISLTRAALMPHYGMNSLLKQFTHANNAIHPGIRRQ